MLAYGSSSFLEKLGNKLLRKPECFILKKHINIYFAITSLKNHKVFKLLQTATFAIFFDIGIAILLFQFYKAGVSYYKDLLLYKKSQG